MKPLKPESCSVRDKVRSNLAVVDSKSRNSTLSRGRRNSAGRIVLVSERDLKQRIATQVALPPQLFNQFVEG